MTPDERLAQVASALTQVGLRYLVMGGHAVRHYGISRDTFDFDFHLSLTATDDLAARLRETGCSVRPRLASFRAGAEATFGGSCWAICQMARRSISNSGSAIICLHRLRNSMSGVKKAKLLDDACRFFRCRT